MAQKYSGILSPHRTRDTQNALKRTKITRLPISNSVNPCGRLPLVVLMPYIAHLTHRDAWVARKKHSCGPIVTDCTL